MTVYMQSTLEIKSLELSRFEKLMAEMVPILEGFGWKLETAFVQFTGRLNTVVDVWTMRDFHHYEQGLMKLMAHPEFGRFQQVLAETVEKEVVTLGYRLSYAPPFPART